MAELSSRLQSLFTSIQSLTKTSTAADFANVASHLTQDCAVNLQSMRELPIFGHQALIEQLKKDIELWHLEEYRIVSEAFNNDEKIVFAEMENQLQVCGDMVTHNETCVAKFDDQGLISDLKLYGCRSIVVAVIQARTGKGPYSNAAHERDFFGDRIRCCD